MQLVNKKYLCKNCGTVGNALPTGPGLLLQPNFQFPFNFFSISSRVFGCFFFVCFFVFFDYGSKDIDESRNPYMSILLGKTGDHRQRCIGFIQEYL